MFGLLWAQNYLAARRRLVAQLAGSRHAERPQRWYHRAVRSSSYWARLPRAHRLSFCGASACTTADTVDRRAKVVGGLLCRCQEDDLPLRAASAATVAPMQAGHDLISEIDALEQSIARAQTRTLILKAGLAHADEETRRATVHKLRIEEDRLTALLVKRGIVLRRALETADGSLPVVRSLSSKY